MSLWWKLGGVAIGLVAAYFLITMYGSARYKSGKADERTAWTQELVKAEKEKLVAYQAGVASVMNADKQYIETVREKIIPITKTIIERATAYAQTPDGASLCLPTERVSELEAFTSGLFAPATVTSSGVIGTVPTNPLGEER